MLIAICGMLSLRTDWRFHHCCVYVVVCRLTVVILSGGVVQDVVDEDTGNISCQHSQCRRLMMRG